MKTTFYKLFLYFDTEEKWLNEMAAKGLVLTSVKLWKYTFEENHTDAYTIKMEYLKDAPSSVEGKEYIAFIEETGAEYVSTLMNWVYFKKNNNLGTFDLFSDIDSKIKHLDRILQSFLIMFFPFLLLGAIQLNYSTTINIVTSVLMGILLILLLTGIIRTYLKINTLKKERQLHE